MNEKTHDHINISMATAAEIAGNPHSDFGIFLMGLVVGNRSMKGVKTLEKQSHIDTMASLMTWYDMYQDYKRGYEMAPDHYKENEELVNQAIQGWKRLHESSAKQD